MLLIKTEYDEKPLSEAIESEIIESDKFTIYNSSVREATE